MRRIQGDPEPVHEAYSRRCVRRLPLPGDSWVSGSNSREYHFGDCAAQLPDHHSQASGLIAALPGMFISYTADWGPGNSGGRSIEAVVGFLS